MNYHELWRQLALCYPRGEAQAIARLVFEQRFGLSLTDILMGKDTQLSADDQTHLAEIAHRLCQHEPVQYVLGHAVFCGRSFTVSPSVLIPRPETEQLCQWILAGGPVPTLLDVGTGSGCIALTLATEWPATRVTACDVSPEALSVARENARRMQLKGVRFVEADILSMARSTPPAPPAGSDDATGDGRYHLIVSNPPYICLRERADMAPNVLGYEPSLALFVPDDDPLRFYRAIADYGLRALHAGGRLYLEINPLYARQLSEMLLGQGYSDISTRDDSYGKTRFITARR